MKGDKSKPAIRTLIATSFICTSPIGLTISFNEQSHMDKKEWKKALRNPKLSFTFDQRVKSIEKMPAADMWEDDFDMGDDLEIPQIMKTNTIQIKREMEMVREFSNKMREVKTIIANIQTRIAPHQLPLIVDTPESFQCDHPILQTLLLTYFATLQEALVLVELDQVEGTEGLQEMVLTSFESLSEPHKYYKTPTKRMQLILKQILSRPDVLEFKTEDISRMVEYVPHIIENLTQMTKDLDSVKL